MIDQYSRAKTKEYELDHFSSASAFCNGGNTLFISGGFNQNEDISTFWSINLEDGEITKLNNAITARQRHSMIYIPSNYVFLIGGNKLNLKVEYYDINNQTVKAVGDLNEQKVEPALAYVDDRYIYAFSNGTGLSFERINLRGELNWEKIEPKMDEEFVLFQIYFAASYNVVDNVSTILFVGGYNKDDSNDSLMNAQYNVKDNKLSYSAFNYKEQTFPEKTFLPINNGVTLSIDNDSLFSPNVWLITYETKSVDNKPLGSLDKHFEKDMRAKKNVPKKRVRRELPKSFMDGGISDLKEIEKRNKNYEEPYKVDNIFQSGIDNPKKQADNNDYEYNGNKIEADNNNNNNGFAEGYMDN